MKEATARIKINKLLEAAGWLFFPDGNAPANIRLEPSVTIKATDLDALGENFEKAEKGFVDFLLLDAKGFPLIVLEAKAENKNPLVGKEQARKYARSQNCRFVILSNGNLHYFWDLERGNERSILRVLKFIACDNGKIGTYVKLVDDRNSTAHPNGSIFFST